MGCTSSYLVVEGKVIKQEKIYLDISQNYKTKELLQAQTLINLITFLRNQIIYYFDKLVYVTGACLYKKPNMSHCVNCILYKISSEFGGDLEKANFSYKEDPPFLKASLENLSIYSQEIIKQLFDFILLLRSYKNIIKQIDKETPKLIYLVFENNDRLSKDNIDKIKKAIDLFKDLTKLRTDILQEYKNQVYDLVTCNLPFERRINSVGEYAAKNNINDIYEIVFLKSKKIDGVGGDEPLMFRNIQWAKKLMENKLKQEKVEDNEFSFLNIIDFRNISKSLDLPIDESTNGLKFFNK